MKNLKSNKNIIFLSERKIAVVVLNTFNGRNNILFASESKVNGDDTQAKLSSLLTDAANFLDCNIKFADLVFEDYDIKLHFINRSFYNCFTKEDVTKQIYKDARLENEFINNIIYSSFKVENNKAHVICKALASNYAIYENYKNIVKACNVKLINCVNIATLLNINNDEVVLPIKNGKVFACHYLNNELVNCFNLDVNFEQVKSNLAAKYSNSIENVEKLIGISKFVSKNNNLDLNISWNFNLKNKALTFVNAADFINDYRNELINQIKTKFMVDNYPKAIIITDNDINKFNNVKIENNIIGLDLISDEFILAMNNIDRLPSIESQAKYDSKVESEFERIAA